MAQSETVEDLDKFKHNGDEAVELAGHGCYNRLVLVACSVISNAVALDMFGFGVVLAAASCDLQLGIREIGVLGSMPFAGVLFAFPWGYFADTRGRRRALLVSCTGGFILAALGSLSPSWQVLLVLKLIGCWFSTASYSLTMAYLGECTGNKHRSEYLFVMNSMNLFSEAVTFRRPNLEYALLSDKLVTSPGKF
ncbi:synaptic vesicle glycoprotein 2C-like [Choristoneura fumiferana]|uniref:synaptic vesicle glycoprotein 2C-like n=1 Tax=Choristoneura fumiferana TaxID=7141 RepID=UPI003D15C70F